MSPSLPASAFTRPCASANSDSLTGMTDSGTIISLNPTPGERVRVISDLHLGHERCEIPSVTSIASICEGTDYLVIAGDLAETRRCAWQQRGMELREEFRALCARKGVQLIELAGNHDPDITPMLLRLWDGNTAIMHGHAIFKEGAPWSWEYLRNKQACKQLIAQHPEADTCLEARLELARAMSRFIPPIMRREGISNPLLRSFMHCFWPPQRPYGIVQSWLTCGLRANRFANQYLPDARNLILGHFHRSGTWHYGQRRIANTGAWFRHATPYYADLIDGRLTLYAPYPLAR